MREEIPLQGMSGLCVESDAWVSGWRTTWNVRASSRFDVAVVMRFLFFSERGIRLHSGRNNNSVG